MIRHQIYENDDDRPLCLECGCPIDYSECYCDECYDKLEAEGYFDLPAPFDLEDFSE